MSDVRRITIPIRIGEWTLAAPARDLHVRRAGIFDGPRSRIGPDAVRVPEGADGCLLVQPVPEPGDAAARPEAPPPGMIRWTLGVGPRYFIRLEGTFDEYLARFSAKTRSGLRRKWRRLLREAGDEVRFARFGAGEFAAFHESAREVSRHTYQEIMFDAGLPDDPQSEAFMRRRMDAGRAEGFVLFIGDTPVAYLYCPCANGVYEYQYVGFRPDYGHWSPGTVLLLMVLEALFDEPGAAAFDFTAGAGESSHKSFYATDSKHFETVVILHRTPANQALILSRRLADSFSELVGAVLRTLGVKRRVRSWIRAARGVPDHP